jgi:hypothetical protein
MTVNVGLKSGHLGFEIDNEGPDEKHDYRNQGYEGKINEQAVDRRIKDLLQEGREERAHQSLEDRGIINKEVRYRVRRKPSDKAWKMAKDATIEVNRRTIGEV